MKCEANFNTCEDKAKYELKTFILKFPSLFVCFKHKQEFTKDNSLIKKVIRLEKSAHNLDDNKTRLLL